MGWLPRRLKHHSWVAANWIVVFLLGHFILGDGLMFFLPVTCFGRAGYAAAWMFITNFNHSHPWQNFIQKDHEREHPWIMGVMQFVHGGKHRWNEMLFHDVHHAFPNAVGTMSQRGRFHGWEKVMHAATKVLDSGLFKENGDEKTKMQKNDKKRSIKLSQ